MEIFRLDGRLAYADQPTFSDLDELRRSFHTIVDVRLPQERVADFSGVTERRGLQYVSLPIPSIDRITEDDLERLDAILRGRDALPALLHSREGGRAGALALTWYAVDVGWTLAELVRNARRLGFDLPEACIRYVARKSLGRVPQPEL